jgi:galactose mutarotase-like enzyme
MTTLTDTIRLTAGDLAAEFAPERGMVATSLRHAGEELLDVGAGRNGIVGVPLLHPWANRLSAHEYTLDGRTVQVPRRLLHCEEHGLPIHGVLAVLRSGRSSRPARTRSGRDSTSLASCSTRSRLSISSSWASRCRRRAS